MKDSSRQILYGLAVFGLMAVVAALTGQPASAPLVAAPAAVQPLDRVPADAGLVAHLQAGDLWNHPLLAETRKSYGANGDKLLMKAEKELGFAFDNVAAVTFHYPKFPAGPGDELLFVLQITTKKPYDKAAVFSGFRAKDAQETDGVVALKEDLRLVLVGETQFAVVHDSLVGEFRKGGPAAKDGVLADTLKAAREGKHTLTFGIDPSGLPAEIFASALAELQPFLPLLKSKAISVQMALDTELTVKVKFVGENEEKATDAERALNLLVKLGDSFLTPVVKSETPTEEVKSLLPALTELLRRLKAVKATRDGAVTSATIAFKADPALAKPIVAAILLPQMAAARAKSSNNLKQIGLAMHNYLDAYKGFPAAAIVDKKGKPLLSWRVAILPFVEQDQLYNEFHLDEAWDSDHNKKLIAKMPNLYALPGGMGKPGETNYRVFVGKGAAFDMVVSATIRDFTDGTSNTLLAIEAAEAVTWTKPEEMEFDPKNPVKKYFRYANAVCTVLLGDGSVRAISEKVDEKILKLLIQRDDGTPIPEY